MFITVLRLIGATFHLRILWDKSDCIFSHTTNEITSATRRFVPSCISTVIHPTLLESSLQEELGNTVKCFTGTIYHDNAVLDFGGPPCLPLEYV